MQPTGGNKPLAAYLSTTDVPCPGCGYNLRGLTTDLCPECRQHLVLTVALSDPPIVAYVLATVGLAACGAAFGLMVLGVFTISFLEGGLPPGDEIIALLWVPVGLVAVDAVAVALFLRSARRRWFRTRSPSGRWVVALGCWGLSLAACAGWLVVLFRFV